jgi:hypothetical protein
MPPGRRAQRGGEAVPGVGIEEVGCPRVHGQLEQSPTRAFVSDFTRAPTSAICSSARSWVAFLILSPSALGHLTIVAAVIPAPSSDGHPDFHRLSARILHGEMSIPVTLMVFDLLAVEGLPVTSQRAPNGGRCSRSLELERPHVRRVATFEDGQALYQAVCDRGLEGVVAKRERDPYRPASAFGEGEKPRVGAIRRGPRLRQHATDATSFPLWSRSMTPLGFNRLRVARGTR